MLQILKIIIWILFNYLIDGITALWAKTKEGLSLLGWNIKSLLVRLLLKILVSKERFSYWYADFKPKFIKDTKETVASAVFRFNHFFRLVFYKLIIFILIHKEKPAKSPELYRGEEPVEEESATENSSEENNAETEKTPEAEDSKDEQEVKEDLNVSAGTENSVEAAEMLEAEDSKDAQEAKENLEADATAGRENIVEEAEMPEAEDSKDEQEAKEDFEADVSAGSENTIEEAETLKPDDVSIEDESRNVEEQPDEVKEEPNEVLEDAEPEENIESTGKSQGKFSAAKASASKLIISWLSCTAASIVLFMIGESMFLDLDLNQGFLPIKGNRFEAFSISMLGLVFAIIVAAETIAALLRFIKKRTIRRSTMLSETTKACLITFMASMCFVARDYVNEYMQNPAACNVLLLAAAALLFLFAAVKMMLIVNRYFEE